MIAERREDALVAHKKTSGIITDPATVAAKPPVPLVQLVLDLHYVLAAAGRADRARCGAGIDRAVVLHPAVDILIVAALIVAVARVTVRRVVDEEMGGPV